MELKILGALEQVTGSCSLLEHENIQILIDFGMSQGENIVVDIDPFSSIDLKKLKVVFLTHAHLDHCGLIPLLYKKGYEGIVISTKATSQLAPLILTDSVNIDGKLYSHDDVNKIRWFYPDMASDFEWCKEIPLTQGGICYYFQPSSHILGSVSIGFTWNYSNGEKKEILFTGDLGSNMNESSYDMLNNKLFFPRSTVNYLVCESTYGDRKRKPEDMLYTERIENLKRVLLECFPENREHSRDLFIPAFSLHRTQELIIDLVIAIRELKKQGFLVNELHLKIDSPLGTEISKVFQKRLCDFMGSEIGNYKNINKELLARFNMNEKEIHKMLYDIFGYWSLEKNEKGKIVNKGYEDEFCKIYLYNQEGKRLQQKRGNIYIASSGMMSDGPMKEWIPLIINDPRSVIAVTGYQAEGTIGNKLISMLNEDKDNFISLGNSLFYKQDIKCSIKTLKGYSGHADQFHLIKYISENCESRSVILNHGTNKMRESLKEKIEELNQNITVTIPNRLMSWMKL